MAKSKKVEYEADGDNEKLVRGIADMINKSTADGSNVAFIHGDESVDDPTKIIDWVPSGNDDLDLAMSNRPHGGFPVGRLTEITGLEGSGKTLLAMHALAETQKKGGVAVFIDTESSLDINFVKAIGVNPKELCYISCDHVEEIFDHIEKIVGKVRLEMRNKLVTIVIDSVAAASCVSELEADHGSQGYATQKAIIISKALRKITQMIARQRVCLVFTNQVRQNLGVTFGDKWTTSGGKALGFHSSIRIRLTKLSQIKHTNGRIMGFSSKARVFKNRLGPPMVEAEFDLFFDRGMDNYGSWFKTIETEKIATKAKTQDQKKKMLDKDEKSLDNYVQVGGAGKKLQFESVDGKIYEFIKSTFTEFLTENPTVKAEIYDRICDAKIMEYKDQSKCADDELIYEEEED